uniref:7TM_GPCR_Srx domain-containing protein n=1 Tax=Caenorhabditis japonica TaxID=281687 RepID=A0A8R1ISK5_CAEJA
MKTALYTRDMGYIWPTALYCVFNEFDFVGGVILCSCAFIIDMLTLVRLRVANNVIEVHCQIATQDMLKRRKNEIRLFSQAFTQCIVFCITLLSFHVFTLFSDNFWWQFSMVTLIWITAHSLDGLIVVLFHFRLSLCSTKHLTSTAMMSSSASRPANTAIIPGAKA